MSIQVTDVKRILIYQGNRNGKVVFDRKVRDVGFLSGMIIAVVNKKPKRKLRRKLRWWKK